MEISSQINVWWALNRALATTIALSHPLETERRITVRFSRWVGNVDYLGSRLPHLAGGFVAYVSAGRASLVMVPFGITWVLTRVFPPGTRPIAMVDLIGWFFKRVPP